MPPPAITDTDIDTIEKLFGLSFDEERRAILRSSETKDIRACPGSGKTTLLVAKLALLTAHWGHLHRGICVLSHTNVARREIQRRFTKAPSLQRLNSYPHFIGTLQSFVNLFLGIPGAIAKFGVRPSILDDERYAFEAQREMFRGLGTKYKGAAFALGKRHGLTKPEEFAEQFAQIEYRNKELALGSGGAPLLLSEQAPTYSQLVQFKEELSRRGYFRYRDMDALGAWYLQEYPEIRGFLRNRFPSVFIDEAQDTIPEESDLISGIFLNGSVIQRFGDDRQAIFRDPTIQGETTGAQFPSQEVLPMRRSHRMSPSIASLVKHVCCEEPEELIGNADNPNCHHTLLLFARERIAHVLPGYASIVAREVGVGLPAADIRAVGATAQRRSDDGKFPSAIADYWPPFVLPTRLGHGRLLSFHHCLTRARSSVVLSAAAADAREHLLEGLARILNIQGHRYNDRPFTGATLPRAFREVGPERYLALNNFLATVCGELATHNVDESDWRTKALDLLSALCPGKWSADVTQFMQSQEIAAAINGADRSADGVFRQVVTDGEVAIQLGTVHSVKGETVKAVLVLETFIYTHDLASVLAAGPLQGSRPKKKPKVRLSCHIKRAFVAMSRPTHLLCLAMLKDHVDDDCKKGMEGIGWRIVEV